MGGSTIDQGFYDVGVKIFAPVDGYIGKRKPSRHHERNNIHTKHLWGHKGR